MDKNAQLLSLCYKQAKPGVWIKPVGASLFSYEENRNEWTNWFIGAKGQTCRWSAEVYTEDDGDFKAWIVHQETWTRINIGQGGDFSILTVEDTINLL